MLNLKQFFTFYPHSDDNTYLGLWFEFGTHSWDLIFTMIHCISLGLKLRSTVFRKLSLCRGVSGFVVVPPEHVSHIDRTNSTLVYGKVYSMWKGFEETISVSIGFGILEFRCIYFHEAFWDQ